MDEAIQSHPIHTMQHGFRNDRNTETAVSEVADYIESNIYNNKFVIAVFLDIQAAFDTIKPELIKEKLLEHGGDPYLVRVAPDCNRSYCEDSFSGYSGSV